VRNLRLGPIAIGNVGYAFACMASAVILVAAGYAYRVVSLTEVLGAGVALGGEVAPSTTTPSVGALNILVMGLESRTTLQGQDLSVQQLTETHSGSESAVEAGLEGSQDTDTLILIHVFAGGQKAVGFSIPRDDVVNFPHATLDGLTEGKIDAAYAFAYDESLGQTVGSGMTQAQRYLAANQAGQLFEVQTVESVTGVHIDHFIESDIIGFYELAQQFGGLEICIRPAPAEGGLPAGANLTDQDPLAGTDNSGFSAYSDGYNRKEGGTQYLHLNAAQSLAYVRSRDTLPGIDIGRTARQQAAIEYILWKLKTGGVLTDLSAITTMLSDAQSYLMYDSGWNLLDFGQDMRALSASNLQFTTLPEISTNNVGIPGYPGAQSANYIDVPQLQQQISEAFYGSPMIPPAASSVTVNVDNGSGADGLAADVSQDLVAMGYKADDSSSQSQLVQDDTEVFYGAGSATEANAQVIADVMGVQSATPLSSLPAGQVEVLLGSQVTAQAPGLEMFGADSVNAADYVTAAEQNDQPIPASVQAIANVGSQSDVPAYEQVPASASPSPTALPGPITSPSPFASPSPTALPGPFGSLGPFGSSTTPGSLPRRTEPLSSTEPTSTSSSSNPPYGLTTCPY
jgi:anionic cell wall polymer biosynthesis LytR-Cps2A-Psr (LCP) family protein